MVQFLSQMKSPAKGLGDRLGDGPSERIAKLVRENPKVSITEMSKKLKISTTAIEKTLKKMRESGTIKRIGKPKSGYWKLAKK
ncbi:MAG: HTH domain-containing protein [Fibrobacteria bacterium]|nr:HTH domain-containing protein [Fibrobacteria bacterium]